MPDFSTIVLSSVIAVFLLPFGQSTGAEIGPAYQLADILADGTKISAPDSSDEKAIKLPSHTQHLKFSVTPRTDREDLCFRYLLEGKDQEWRSLGSGQVFIQILDSQHKDVGRKTISYTDQSCQSPSWNGKAATTPLVSRSVTLPLPSGAHKLMIHLAPRGQNEMNATRNIGTYVFSELAIKLTSSDNGKPPVQYKPRLSGMFKAYASRLMEKPAQNQSIQEPASYFWKNLDSDILSKFCELIKGPENSERLVIHDPSDRVSASWITKEFQDQINVTGMKEATLTWEEAWFIGKGGPGGVRYDNLPPGKYTLRVQAMTADGVVYGRESRTPLIITPPFYETRGFLMICTLSGGLFVGLILRQVTKSRLEKRLSMLEKYQAVEEERRRISMDLHDHLGSDLTHLALLSELAKESPKAPQGLKGQLQEIFHLAKDLTRHTDEIVWSLSPKHDSLDAFVSYAITLIQTRLQASGISTHFDVPHRLPESPLNSRERHHLLMVVKEVVHNVVKHSQAKHACVSLCIHERRVDIRFEDDGRGFQEDPGDGHGRQNLQLRLKELGGHVTTGNRAEGGAFVLISIPLQITQKNH